MEAHKFLLAHNFTFICYSVLTGALSHLSKTENIIGYNKPIQSLAYYQKKLAIKVAK